MYIPVVSLEWESSDLKMQAGLFHCSSDRTCLLWDVNVFNEVNMHKSEQLLHNLLAYFSWMVAWHRATSPTFNECTFMTPVRPLQMQMYMRVCMLMIVYIILPLWVHRLWGNYMQDSAFLNSPVIAFKNPVKSHISVSLRLKARLASLTLHNSLNSPTR